MCVKSLNRRNRIAQSVTKLKNKENGSKERHITFHDITNKVKKVGGDNGMLVLWQ